MKDATKNINPAEINRRQSGSPIRHALSMKHTSDKTKIMRCKGFISLAPLEVLMSHNVH